MEINAKMKPLNPTTAADFLATQGVQPTSEIQKVLSGFDFAKPMYVHDFWPGDILYQFIRLSSALNLVPSRGSWYGIEGITQQGVAIFDGLAGRKLYRFEVVHPFSALEGTAATLPLDWHNEIGGPGGATQVFVPRRFAGHIHSLGAAADW